MFEKDQGYVALSLVATIKGLQVLWLDPKKVPFPLLPLAFVPHSPMVDILFTRTDPGLCASQSHGMEQVVGESDEMMLTIRQDTNERTYASKTPRIENSIEQMRTVCTIALYLDKLSGIVSMFRTQSKS